MGAGPGGDGGPTPGALQRLVRALPALRLTRCGRHGTFADVIARLPVHRRHGLRRALPAADPSDRPRPTARAATTRLVAGPDDPGEPWAIGAAEGGHTAIHPELGTLEDFDAPGRRGARARASRSRSTSPSSARPTTPACSEHPEWFRQRPDGTIQYAENPPKKYQDIYPFDFESEDWRGAVGRAARASFALLDRPRRAHLPRRQPAHQALRVLGVADRARSSASTPTCIFLAEAFTRPKVMYRLAKLGFTQSYTYFTWRNTQAGADRVLHRADAAAGARVLPPQLLAQHARHPARVPADGGRAGLHGAAGAGRDAGAELRHLRPGLRAAARTRRASPAARSTSTPRSTSCATGTCDGPSSLAPFIARAQPHPARATRRCSATRGLRFHADRQRPAARLHQDARADGGERRRWSWSTSTRTTPHSGWVELPLDELGLEPTQRLPGARPAQRRRATSGTARATSCELDPQRVPGPRSSACAAAAAHRARLRLLPVSGRPRRSPDAGIAKPADRGGPACTTIRSGTRTPSSTSCTSRPSATATATASATSAA